MKNPLFALVFLFSANVLLGQGIRGLITDENGDPLPYASIYIKEKGTGTSSNANGNYELRLPSGSYEVTFQFVGYATEVQQVKVGKGFETLDLSLKPQTETLLDVNVTASAEDPAYTIMRKAIAKAPYHLLQYDGYTARVYIKGSGGLSKIPDMFRKMAAKEGVDTGRVFTSESVSEVSFERPSTFTEKVISVRTSGESLDGANPNNFVNASFYLPKLAESISPFSPRAFSYYRFRYLGNFEDRGYKVHKVEVKPRSPGDKVFEGQIYIRDGFWNIHSLDLTTQVEVFSLNLVQFFAPVQGEIWMPVTQKYVYEASMFGFAGTFSYLASVINYTVKENDDLDETVILVDEKIEQAPEEIEAIKDGEVDEGLKEVFEKDKEVSRKQFGKLLKKYEKQERKESGQEDILSDYTYKIDSLAAKKDSSYWAEVRSVPLTPKEVESYRKDDSIYAAEVKDSVERPSGNGFDLGDLLLGGRADVSKRVKLRFPGIVPRFRFNTVEGFNLDLETQMDIYADSAHWQFVPTLRYGFSGTELYAKLNSSVSFGPLEKRNTWRLEGGHFIGQFHPGSIDPFINSAYSLFLERNYMRLYENDFVNLTYSHNFRYKLKADVSLGWASRSSLVNHVSFRVFDFENQEYFTNDPENIETNVGDFADSKAFTSQVQLHWNPWLKYRKFNGMLRPVRESSPEFRLAYRSGWNKILGSTVDFQHLEVGFKTEFDLGVRATFDLDAEAGTFLRNQNLLFMDYKHFDGGLTEIAPISVTGNFRALDYYLYSTDGPYVSALSHIRFRKLLFTHLPLVRLSGVKENFFVNYLKTSNSPHYTELGYGIDNIFRILRVELVQTFNGIEPGVFAVRVGVASVFGGGR